MKRTIAILSLLAMLLPSFAACDQAGDPTGTAVPTVTQASTQVPTPDPTNTNTEKTPTPTPSDEPILPEITGTFVPGGKHEFLTEVPSSVTLVGSYSLPPIDDQGEIGSCASQSIAYNQFSNAVARYLHALNSNSKFNPSSGEKKYIFSPKYTYNFSGAGTAWVYDILVDHGCLTLEDSIFQKFTGSSKLINDRGGSYYEKSVKWEVKEGNMSDALNYRLTGYEQIWLTKAPYNGQITDIEQGQDLIFKIKEALATGNCVVTGGYPERWRYGAVTNGGDLGKAGEHIITHSVATGAGGHQVTIVGYDDNIETELNGVTLKGAFLIANSYGKKWKNKGYVWVAYDALNTVSEHEELKSMKGRGWTMDQFCFTYWDQDVIIEYPELTTEVVITTKNRENFYIELYCVDKNGEKYTYLPKMFQYGAGGSGYHPQYGTHSNFDGKVDSTEESTGYFTLSYVELIKKLPVGTDLSEYTWGVTVYGTKAGNTVKIGSLKLFDENKNVISSVTPTATTSKVTGQRSLSFKFEK